MRNTLIRTAGACAALGVGAVVSAQTLVVRWTMDPVDPGEYQFDVNEDGVLDNPVTRDVRDAPGQGTDDPFDLDAAGPADDELFFISTPLMPFPTSTAVPPVSMFINGNDAGAFSYDASAIRGFESGGMFMPQDTYGQDLAISGGLSVEMFIRTNTDQSQDGEADRIQTLYLQAEGDLRYALILNESGPGELRWALNDRVGTIVVCDLIAENLGDGTWWYVLATYDPDAGVNGKMQLTVVNEDGERAATVVTNVPGGFQGLPTDSTDNNTLIGFDAFAPGMDDPDEGRRFDGLIDEIQVTDGLVPEGERLGFVPPDLEPPTITDGPIARWDMAPTDGNFPATLDLLRAPEEAGGNDLVTFNSFGLDLPTSGDVPPAGMFTNGNDGGSTSFDPAAFTGGDGAVFYPQDSFGDAFSFTGGFSIEMFFRSDGDQSGAGVQQLLLQGETSFRYGLTVNENVAGGVRFAINDNEDGDPTFVLCDLVDIEDDQNFLDGQWHYLLATYDPDAGDNGEIAVTVVDEDGDRSATTCPLPADFAPLPDTNDGNMFLGRNTFGVSDEPRTFQGLIDEIQISNGIVPDDARLGFIPTPPAPPGPVGYYKFDPAPDLPDPIGGTNPVTLDVEPTEGGNHLWSFNGLTDGGTQSQLFSSMIPPASLLNAGVDPSPNSFNAQALTGVDGAFFYPQDVYGDVYSFTGSFAVECFFKTDGDQSGAGVQQLVIQGEAGFRFGLVLNENAPGGLRFAVNDDEPDDVTFVFCDLLPAGRNYADGAWHYVLAEYDAEAGELRLTVLNEDGSIDETACPLPPEFAGLPEGNNGNMFIGRNTFPVGADPRTFQGVMDELRFSRGIPEPGDLLGALPAGCNVADIATPFGILDLSDINAFVTAFTTGEPAADIAEPFGIFDLNDISAFITAFQAGCP